MKFRVVLLSLVLLLVACVAVTLNPLDAVGVVDMSAAGSRSNRSERASSSHGRFAPRDCAALGCVPVVERCLRKRGYVLSKKAGYELAPKSVPNTEANSEAIDQLDYANTPDGENSLPLGLTKPGVVVSLSIYEGIEGARAAAQPTRGATIHPSYRGDVAFVAWRGHPAADIGACARH